MTHSEYIDLFHRTQANLVAFLPLLECDEAVIKMIETAVAAEREACAKVCDGWPDYDVQGLAEAIRARGQRE